MFQQEVEAQIDRGGHASGRRHQAVLDDPLVDDLCGPAQFVHRAPMRRRLASGEETRGHQDQGAGADASHGLLRPEVQKGLQPIGVLDDLFPSLPPGHDYQVQIREVPPDVVRKELHAEGARDLLL